VLILTSVSLSLLKLYEYWHVVFVFLYNFPRKTNKFGGEKGAQAFQLCFPTGYTVINIRKRLVWPQQDLNIRQENC